MSDFLDDLMVIDWVSWDANWFATSEKGIFDLSDLNDEEIFADVYAVRHAVVCCPVKTVYLQQQQFGRWFDLGEHRFEDSGECLCLVVWDVECDFHNMIVVRMRMRMPAWRSRIQ